MPNARVSSETALGIVLLGKFFSHKPLIAYIALISSFEVEVARENVVSFSSG